MMMMLSVMLVILFCVFFLLLHILFYCLLILLGGQRNSLDGSMRTMIWGRIHPVIIVIRIGVQIERHSVRAYAE